MTNPDMTPGNETVLGLSLGLALTSIPVSLLSVVWPPLLIVTGLLIVCALLVLSFYRFDVGTLHGRVPTWEPKGVRK